MTFCFLEAVYFSRAGLGGAAGLPWVRPCTREGVVQLSCIPPSGTPCICHLHLETVRMPMESRGSLFESGRTETGP